MDGTFMLTSFLIVRHHSRQSVPNSTTPLPPILLTPCHLTPFLTILYPTPTPLNPVVSILYKNSGGGARFFPVIPSGARDLHFPYFLIFLLRCFFTSSLQSSERLNHVPQTQHFSKHHHRFPLPAHQPQRQPLSHADRCDSSSRERSQATDALRLPRRPSPSQHSRCRSGSPRRRTSRRHR